MGLLTGLYNIHVRGVWYALQKNSDKENKQNGTRLNRRNVSIGEY